MKKVLLSIFLVLLGGCASTIAYVYETDLPSIRGEGDTDDSRIVSKWAREPIARVKYGPWLMPSGWAVRLATQWGDLPFVFDPRGPEYCAALGVDRDRMLHASMPVRFRDDNTAKIGCPTLIWKNDEFMIGLGMSHSHPLLVFHGERISGQDAAMGSPLHVESNSKTKIEMLRVAVHFFSGEHLIGVDPATGKEAPVPAQSLLFTRANGKVRVFMWVPSAYETPGKQNFVTVYKPVPNDQWEAMGTCWIETSELRDVPGIRSVPSTHCDPDDLWWK